MVRSSPYSSYRLQPYILLFLTTLPVGISIFGAPVGFKGKVCNVGAFIASGCNIDAYPLDTSSFLFALLLFPWLIGTFFFARKQVQDREKERKALSDDLAENKSARIALQTTLDSEKEERRKEHKILTETLEKERKKQRLYHKKTIGTILNASSEEAIKYGRRYTRSILKIEWEHVLHKMSADYQSQQYYHDIGALLSSFKDETLRFAEMYFGLEQYAIGANYMWYFTREDLSDSFTATLLADNGFHIPSTLSDCWTGILYMPKCFHQPPLEQSSDIQLCLPVFKFQDKIEGTSYSTKCSDTRIVGAQEAIFKGNSYIRNTHAPESYKNIDKDIRQAQQKCFESRAADMKSLMSFSIPHQVTTQEDKDLKILSVLNIETNDETAFDNRAKWHPVFYSHIYPLMLRLSSYFSEYHKYLLKELQYYANKHIIKE